MKKSSIIYIVITIVVIGGGLWVWMMMGQAGSTYNQPTQPTAIPSATGNGVTAGTLILNTMTDPTLGTYLVATNGMTLYSYSPDTPGVSNCNGGCAIAWPPYTVSNADISTLAAGLGIDGKLATFTRADGKIQLTYKGVPLYTYVKDKNPGDTTGQGVGGIWFVVHP